MSCLMDAGEIGAASAGVQATDISAVTTIMGFMGAMGNILFCLHEVPTRRHALRSENRLHERGQKVARNARRSQLYVTAPSRVRAASLEHGFTSAC